MKAIGVCNFDIEHLERILNECEVKPVLNQVECHPHFAQFELKEFCAKHDIFVEAWGPLEQGGDILKDEAVKQIAEAHRKISGTNCIALASAKQYNRYSKIGNPFTD